MKKFDKLIIGIIVLILYFIYPYITGSILPSAIKSNTLELIIRVICDCIFIAVLFMLYKDDIKKEWKIFKKNPIKIFFVSFGFLILGMILMMISIRVVSIFTNNYVPHSQVGIKELWPVVPWYGIWLTLISSVFIDEIVFRKTFKSVLPNTLLFLIISCLVNGFYFIGYSMSSINDVLCIIPYALFALAEALAYLKTKTIVSPMLIHFLFNLWMLVGVLVTG